MKKFFLVVALISLFHNGAIGSLRTSIDSSRVDECVSITTVESSNSRFVGKFEIHGFYDRHVIIDGTTYHQLSFDDPTSLKIIGEPALPVISRLIALPQGERFDVRIKDEVWTDEIHIGQIMPYQQDVLETEDISSLEKKKEVYSYDVYQTERLSIGNLQKWRGVNNKSLTICPVLYMPKRGNVKVLREFVLEINFDEALKKNQRVENVMNMFLNSSESQNIETFQQDRLSSEHYDYLIIAGNIQGILESQALADFRKWKAFKGLKTKVFSTMDIGTTAAQIKQFISNEYPKGIKYVLFIGDSDKIPLYSYYMSTLSITSKSDYWYGCMDGSNDVQADICIGRFSTNDLTELGNMVSKTISYEKNSRCYGNEALLVAHRENAPYNYQGCSETIRTNSYSETLNYSTAYGASISLGGDNATNANVVNYINAGKNIINYRGHGDYDQWWSWDANSDSFFDTQISLLDSSTNDIYFCVACLNGNIHNQTCFMETFMRSNHGAAGMIAATEATYTYTNHTYNQYIFSKLLNDNIYNIGELNVAAHIANMGSSSNYAIYNAFSYICGCDPSLEIITGDTQTFNDYNLSLTGGYVTIDNSINGYKVCIVAADESLYSVTNTTGYSCTLAIPNDNFYIVLNKHNYEPRIIYVNVTDNDIQNQMFNNVGMDNYYIKPGTKNVGYDVTTSIPYGNVSVESGSKLTIDVSSDVLIKNGFECKAGGELLIK